MSVLEALKKEAALAKKNSNQRVDKDVQLTIRFDAETVEDAEEVARAFKVNRATVFRMIVAKAMPDWIAEAKERIRRKKEAEGL